MTQQPAHTGTRLPCRIYSQYAAEQAAYEIMHYWFEKMEKRLAATFAATKFAGCAMVPVAARPGGPRELLEAHKAALMEIAGGTSWRPRKSGLVLARSRSLSRARNTSPLAVKSLRPRMGFQKTHAFGSSEGCWIRRSGSQASMPTTSRVP